MANKKISELTASTELATGDLLPVVDISDTAGAASGTTKKITWAKVRDAILQVANAFTAVQTFTAGFIAAAASSITANEAGALLTLNQQGTGDVLALQDGGTNAVRFPDQGGTVLVPQSGGFQTITGLVGYDSDKDRLVLQHEHHNVPVPVDGRNTFVNYFYPIEYP